MVRLDPCLCLGLPFVALVDLWNLSTSLLPYVLAALFVAAWHGVSSGGSDFLWKVLFVLGGSESV